MMILVIIICYFAGLLLIAHITGHKGGSNAAFFKGENKSPWYIVSFGMIGATISGVTFVSVPGMVRGMDMTYMQTVFGFFFGYMIVAHILLPLYYRLNLTSIYGYLGTRIGVNAYRTGSFFFLLSRMLGTAAKLYLVCLILHTHVFQDMHIPFWVIAVGSVALVWIYTHKSGIKTIVWTDTLQTFCLIAALLFIIYFTIQKLDIGFDGIVQTIRHSEHSRIRRLDVPPELLQTVLQRHLYRHRHDRTRSGHDAEEPLLPQSARSPKEYVLLRILIHPAEFPVPVPGHSADRISGTNATGTTGHE